MKAILIAVSCYALTYLVCGWFGDSNQVDSFLDEVAQHDNAMITSPPTRVSQYDQARPPVIAASEKPPQMVARQRPARRGRRVRRMGI